MNNDYSWIKEAEGETRIEKLRNIVKNQTISQVGMTFVDVQTANMLVTIYDAMTDDEAKRCFEIIPFSKLVDIGWRGVRAATPAY